MLGGGSTIRIATSPVGADRWALAGTGLEIGAGPVPQPQLVLHGSAGWFVEIDRTVVDGARLSSGSWTSWQPPCLDAMGPARIAAASASGLVAACDVGQWATPQGVHLFTSNDAGATFVEATAGVPTSDVEAIAAAPSSQTVVVAGTLSGGGAGLVASFDGGKTWSTAYEPKGATSIAELGFTTASQGVAIVTAAGGSSGLVMTADGGRSWTPVPVAGA